MSSPAHPAPVLRRRRWPLFLPFVLVVLLAAVWTGLWFYAAARAETEIASFREREFRGKAGAERGVLALQRDRGEAAADLALHVRVSGWHSRQGGGALDDRQQCTCFREAPLL